MAPSPKSASSAPSNAKTSTTESSTFATQDTSSKAVLNAQYKRISVVIVSVVVALSVVLLIVLLVLPGYEKVCKTKACVEAGKTLFESINFTVNPCDDFYEYACGNWMAQHPIPDDSGGIGAFGQQDDKLMKEVRELLEQKHKSKRPVAKSVQLVWDLYRECMDTDARNTLGYKPLKQLLTELLGTSWPILDDRFVSKQNFTETFARFKLVGVSRVFSFGVGKDLRNRHVKIISFGTSSFNLERDEHANRTKYASKIEAYRKRMLDYGKLFAGKNVDEKLLQTRLDEVFELDSKLALFSRSDEESRDIDASHNKMTFAAFKKNTSFDGLAYLRVYTEPFNLSFSFKDTDLVDVFDISYYKKMTKLLNVTPIYVLYNYMGLSLINEFSAYAGKELFAITTEYKKKVSGIKTSSPEWERCVDLVDDKLGWAISRLYVDQVVLPGTKERAKKMIADLRAAFNEIVRKEAKWLDETTCTKTLEKAQAC